MLMLNTDDDSGYSLFIASSGIRVLQVAELR